MTDTLRVTGRYPPTIQQQAIITMLSNGDSSGSSYFDVKLAHLICPGIELRRLERTFEKLCARHDALRQSFERQGDDWFVDVWNRHRTGLIVEDHGDISDADFDALVQHQTSIRVELFDAALFQVAVLKCGARGDILFIRCHHAIIDGHALTVLIDEWIRLLIGIPLLGRGMTHEEFLSKHMRLSPQQNIENQKYWDEMLFPALPNPGLGKFGKPGDRPRVVYRTDTFRSIERSVSNDAFNEIPKAANAPAQTAFSLIFASFADRLIDLSGLPGIYISTTFDNRTSSKLRNFVGCAICWPPIRCAPINGMSLSEYSSNLAAQLNESLTHLPNPAAVYESDIDMAVHKSGGLLRHFQCSMAVGVAGPKKSSRSTAKKTAAKAPLKVGAHSVTRLRLKNNNHNFNGLRLRMRPNGDQMDFELKYHSHFYTEDDMKTLLSGMQEKLHIQLT